MNTLLGCRRQQDLHASCLLANFVAFLKWLAIDRLDAGCQFILPAVPGTGNASVFDDAFGQRAPLMGAHAIKSKKLPARSKDGNNLALDNQFDCPAFLDRVALPRLHPVFIHHALSSADDPLDGPFCQPRCDVTIPLLIDSGRRNPERSMAVALELVQPIVPNSQSRMRCPISAFVLGFCFIGMLPLQADDRPSDAGGKSTDTKESSGDVMKITEIEGISEYVLENGVRVLLFPDPGKEVVTVNMTVFVGSRHEGYGEAGMAHLLEHMLFKGTPGHPDVPKVLKDRGARMNGTTWMDRTNYYETLPATGDNLEFAIRLEADRLVNSNIRGEDLASEMTVVRNEFESGENSPFRVMMQRMQAAAYEWHNYGRTTIGNRSDIERVPVVKLRQFYRKFYRPDNVMVIVAGKFDPGEALEHLNKYFGAIKSPEQPIDQTYTVEPAQDGERTVVVRRVGEVQLVGNAYHIPSGSHPDYAAAKALVYILGDEPSGRLYRNLVETETATNVYSLSYAFTEPGLFMAIVEVPAAGSIEQARMKLIDVMENSFAEEPITDQELQRAVQQILKQRELESADTDKTAVSLSDWAAQGDWRLYFLYRDSIEKLTRDHVQEVAEKYFVRNNRTVGLFIPADQAERVEIPESPNLAELLKDYKGREAVAAGEQIDPSPLAIEARTERGSTLR